MHNRPTISQTLLLQNMYQNPALNAPIGPDGLPMPVDARQSQEHFEVRPACTAYWSASLVKLGLSECSYRPMSCPALAEHKASHGC